MKKSVYSLVLTDDVVAEVDRLAYRNGTNRSNMINQILAEYVSYVTPERRIREVFDRIGALLGEEDCIRAAADPSDTMLTLRSALVYKYNPTVRYHVELYREGEAGLGELRVSMRTQNPLLLCVLERFFDTWRQVETALIGTCEYRQEPGKLCRRLSLRLNRRGAEDLVSSNTLGEWIAAYIRAFDTALKAFFEVSDTPEAAVNAVYRVYETYLRTCDLLI